MTKKRKCQISQMSIRVVNCGSYPERIENVNETLPKRYMKVYGPLLAFLCSLLKCDEIPN